MRWMNNAVDWVAEFLGSVTFLVIYNIATFAWFFFGIYDPHFFDPYPNNFLTFIMSWLAIDMQTLLLWAGSRKEARARREEEHKLHTLNTLKSLAEAQSEMIPLVRQIALNQVMILEIMKEEREGVKT